MSYNDGVFRNFNNSFSYLVKFRCRTKHGIVDSRKFYYKRLNRTFRIDKAYKLVNYFMTIKFVYSNFGNPFLIELPSGSCYIKYCIHISKNEKPTGLSRLLSHRLMRQI